MLKIFSFLLTFLFCFDVYSLQQDRNGEFKTNKSRISSSSPINVNNKHLPADNARLKKQQGVKMGVNPDNLQSINKQADGKDVVVYNNISPNGSKS